MEKSLPNYLQSRYVSILPEMEILTDEEFENLRTLQANTGFVKLNNGKIIHAVSVSNERLSPPCGECFFKKECALKLSELNPQPIYMLMCMPHKRPDGKSVKFIKI